MINLTKLEPIGLTLLAGGVLYSILVLILDNKHFKFHFIILTFIIFAALFLITGYKYLMYRYNCEKINNIISAMKKK